jgi:hypothetical protein
MKYKNKKKFLPNVVTDFIANKGNENPGIVNLFEIGRKVL